MYWIRKLQARILANDYAAALAAAARAERLLWMSPAIFERADYHFYAALALIALCEAASDAESAQYREGLAVHHRQLQAWAEHCPENFVSRAALVGAEIARIEGRELDAERLYEAGDPLGPHERASFTMRRWRTNWRPASIWRAASKISALSCATPAPAISVGALMARCDSSTTVIHASGRKRGLLGPTSTIEAPGRTARPRDRHQGITSRLERDRVRKTDRHAHAHGDRAGGRRARLVGSGARSRAADRGGGDDERRQSDRACGRPVHIPIRSSGVGAELCSTHPGQHHTRRCRGRVPFCRRPVHPSPSCSVHSLPAVAQSGQARRRSVSGEQPRPSRFRAGPYPGA